MLAGIDSWPRTANDWVIFKLCSFYIQKNGHKYTRWLKLIIVNFRCGSGPYNYLRGILSHGRTPIRVMVQQASKPKFWRTHSRSLIEGSLSPSITTTTCLGMSNEPGDFRSIRSCANDLLPLEKILGIIGVISWAPMHIGATILVWDNFFGYNITSN